ncbi:hypothetical protein CN558_26290 [Bacillus wiedmannii]|uniref:Uncharacterized protein n=1 Tax=Bacillus wiedmannii TaxID=1890302 RepID=A0A2A8CJR7_9BACI|nr:hypothetical protein CN690_13185 [Bacillus wiedmannii]PEL77244.1 hypothetical protein CN609_25360 [Bacillus wiedmannii]PEM34409.1 hypothetical protein CN598_02135 [Bacillus wiedmannii]PEM87389.1 hypothetical protein CN627_15085 [Bacillus wiedmannii]PEO80918.1 hypothetical protein CN558_26290 [Bacillus wiedmannii]
MHIMIQKNNSLCLKLQAMNIIENKSHLHCDYTTYKKRDVAHSAFL